MNAQHFQTASALLMRASNSLKGVTTMPPELPKMLAESSRQIRIGIPSLKLNGGPQTKGLVTELDMAAGKLHVIAGNLSTIDPKSVNLPGLKQAVDGVRLLTDNAAAWLAPAPAW